MSKSLFVFVYKNRLLIRFISVLVAVCLLLLSPILIFIGEADAAQITVRSLTISTAEPAATNVTYAIGASTGATDTTNGFFFGSSHIVKAMKIQACTTPVFTATCTAPSNIDMSGAGGFTLTGWQDATAFTHDTTNQNDCDGTQTNIICISRSGATTAEDTTHSHKIVITGITNPDNSYVNKAFYLRMTTYTNATYTAGSATDTGAVAAAIVQTLTVSAHVAEILNFCIGTTDASNNDATSNIGNDCTNISGTSVDIGTLDSSIVNISPVNTSGGSNTVGVAMVRSNAANGTAISYRAIQASSGTNHLGTLRLSGANCDATNDNTDGCINAAGSNQTPFVAGQEMFGMTIEGVNCGSTNSYTCNFSAGETDLAPTAQYIGDSYVQGTSGAFGASAAKGFAWDESGNAVTIATSSNSPIKQIDDEVLMLAFGATSNIITPFGSYSVQADFIAVPTY